MKRRFGGAEGSQGGQGGALTGLHLLSFVVGGFVRTRPCAGLVGLQHTCSSYLHLSSQSDATSETGRSVCRAECQ